MKVNLILFFVLTTHLMFAQITITADQLQPTIGDVFEYQEVDYFETDSSGINKYWDYSQITATGESILITYNAPAPNSSQTNFLITTEYVLSQETTEEKVNINDSSFKLYEYSGSNIIEYYTNPKTQVFYPLNFADTVYDEFAFMGTHDSATVNGFGELRMAIDAQGTLQLPGKLYSNVYRVKTFEQKLIVRENEMFYEQTLSYRFYTEFVPTYLLKIEEKITNADTTFSAEYLNTNFVSTKNFEQVEIILFPNPTEGMFEVTLTGPIGETTDIEVYSVSGSLVYFSSMNSAGNIGQSQIDLSHVEPGMYFVKLSTSTGVYTKEVVVQ